MMKKIRRTFDKEFKLEVVKRSLGEVSVSELAEEPDIHPGVISRWRKEFLDTGEQLSFPVWEYRSHPAKLDTCWC